MNGADFARTTKPVSFSLLEKERFLESKEKGASKRVRWLQIGIRRPGFTPPPSTSTVHRRLRRWNRDKPWFYPTFFRRLGRRVSGRGAAAWYTSIVGCGSVSFTYSLFTVTSYFSLWGATTSARHGTTFQACHSEAKPKNPFPRPLRSTSPTKWVVLREDEQGSEVRFRRQAETKQSGLCEDEADFARTTRGARP